jgi:uncharacterized membrane protein HdeD (DUF308 family)
MKGNLAYWIGGTLAAFLGVGLVRLLAPALAGFASSLAVAAGFLLVIVGITVIARATRPRSSEDFVTTEKKAKN